jgi:EAL domain-containing protein (putative c-di-GMP-specific phosphodiesterase class I)
MPACPRNARISGGPSLNYLTFYPINRLKIAQELVFRLNSNPRKGSVVRAAIRLADELGIDLIAEGRPGRRQ